MTPVRVERSFARLLVALAEMETLCANHAFPGAEARLPELETRMQRYLRLSDFELHRPGLAPLAAFESMLTRLREAIRHGQRDEVYRAAGDLRDELAGHFRMRHPASGSPGIR